MGCDALDCNSSQLTVGRTFPFRSVKDLWPLFLWIHSSFCFMKCPRLYEFVLINKVAYRTQASWTKIGRLLEQTRDGK